MSVCALVLGLAFLIITILCLKSIQDTSKLYAVLIFGLFLAVNGIGIAIPPSVTNSVTEYDVQPWWLVQSGLAYIPLALAAIWVLIQGRSRDDETLDRSLILRTEYFWILSVANLIFAALTLRFMTEDGFDKITMLFQIDSFDSLYRERYSFEQEFGHGWFSSFIIYRFLGLLTCGLILVYAKQYSLWIRYASTLPLLLITLMRSATELQRGPIITQLLLISALLTLPWILERRQRAGSQNGAGMQSRLLIVGGFLFAIVVGAGLVIFQVTHEDESALISFPRRVFIIPAHTASLYFGLFPDTIAFRGVAGSFTMPLGDWKSWQNDTFNLKQIGYCANGEPHHPNSNFIASSYSAAGWVSVALTSSVFIGMVLWFNRAFARVDSIFPALATIITFHGIYAIVQIDFVAAMTYGFGASQVLMIAASYFCLTQAESNYLDDLDDMDDMDAYTALD